ncbi:MAG: hypothetical protein M1434_04755 [Chloroflexi bacterium]|nr:hypothetical protein [Chloroflexota bacterium]MCL5274043.1 hypothetical protein [Chloroflexota bacterium]
MAGNTDSTSRTTIVARILSILATFGCLIITVSIWASVASRQAMWPLPALYLIETVALCIIVAIATVYSAPLKAVFSWVAAGAILGFAVLAAFSIGIYYTPVVLLLAIVGIVHLHQTRRHIAQLLIWSAAGAIAQIVLMLGVISLLATN